MCLAANIKTLNSYTKNILNERFKILDKKKKERKRNKILKLRIEAFTCTVLILYCSKYSSLVKMLIKKPFLLSIH